MVSARSTHRRRLFASHSVVLAVGFVSGPRAWWFHERTHRVLPKPTTLERPQPAPRRKAAQQKNAARSKGHWPPQVL
jgi:hypothetical protein